MDADYGVFEHGVFKSGLFAKYRADRGIAWPKTESGRLQLNQDTFRDQAKVYPELAPLRELRHSLSELLAPEGATKASHRAVRDLCKACVLGTSYGMGARTLAFRTNTSIIEAEALLRMLHEHGLRLEAQRDKQHPSYRSAKLPYAVSRR